MSEIPLRSFGLNRKSRAGYSALGDSDTPTSDDPSDSNPSTHSKAMPMIARAAVTASAANARQKGKHRERYADDPEEQANLLGDEPTEDDYREGEPEQTSRPGASVRFDSSDISLDILGVLH